VRLVREDWLTNQAVHPTLAQPIFFILLATQRIIEHHLRSAPAEYDRTHFRNVGLSP
jgi:hypothetical protein